MRAIEYGAYGGPDVLAIASYPSPEPAAGEVLIDVHAVSVNPVDWKIRAGHLKPMPPAFPARTGRDGAGIVRSVGEGVSNDLVGSRVCFLAPRGQGTWAEQITLPAELAVPFPNNLSFAQAAAIPLAGASAWIGLVETGRIQQGMRVLIHAGAGGVGGLAVQLARHCGAHVIVTCSAHNAAYVRSLGASEIVKYDQTRFEDVVREVDLVFDLLGGEVHRRSYSVLRKGGTLVYLNAEPVEERGAEYGVNVRMAQILPSPTALTAVVERVAIGAIRPQVDCILPFEAYAQAHALSERGHGRGKIILAIR